MATPANIACYPCIERFLHRRPANLRCPRCNPRAAPAYAHTHLWRPDPDAESRLDYALAVLLSDPYDVATDRERHAQLRIAYCLATSRHNPAPATYAALRRAFGPASRFMSIHPACMLHSILPALPARALPALRWYLRAKAPHAGDSILHILARNEFLCHPLCTRDHAVVRATAPATIAAYLALLAPPPALPSLRHK